MILNISATFQLKQSKFEIKKMIMSCVENHFGLLPEICELVMKYKDCFKTKEILNIIKETEICINSGNYDSRISIYLFTVHLSNFCMENQYYLESNTRNHRLLLVNKNAISMCFNPIKHFYHFKLFYFLKRYEDAIKSGLEYEKYHLLKYGMQPSEQLFTIYGLLTLSFIQMNKFQDAKRCNRQVRKFIPKHKYTRKLQKRISKKCCKLDIPIKCNVKKCSYAKCENVESQPHEFQQCSNCELVYYCSRNCGKLDWKFNHKSLCCKETLSA